MSAGPRSGTPQSQQGAPASNYDDPPTSGENYDGYNDGYVDANGNYQYYNYGDGAAGGYDEYGNYYDYDPESGVNPVQNFYPEGSMQPETQWQQQEMAVKGGPASTNTSTQQQPSAMPPGPMAGAPPATAVPQAAPAPAGPPPVPPGLENLPVEEQEKRIENGFKLLRYQPEKEGGFKKVFTEAALSLAFRLWFSYLLYTVLITSIFNGLNFLVGTTYRMFSPPNASGDSFWQSMGYFVEFFLLGFTIVAWICCIWDMLREWWTTTREDVTLWGFCFCTEKRNKAPWGIHALLVLFTFLIPLVWALILTVSNGRTVVYFAQFFFYITTVITQFIVVLVFGWFWLRSIDQKRRAYKRRKEDEDLPTERAERPHPTRTQVDVPQTTGVPVRGGKKVKGSFLQSETVMEEYGLDRTSFITTMLVMVLGLVPFFIIGMVIMIQLRNTDMNIAWVAIGVIMLCVMVMLPQVFGKKRRAQSAGANIFFIVIFFGLGLIGCGSIGSGINFAVYIALCCASQMMLLRKRNHKLKRREINRLEALEAFIDEEEDKELQEQLFDNYLCVCRNTLFAAISGCIEIRTTFGYTHPAVRAEEKAQRKRRIALRSDQKFLLFYWLFAAFCLLMVYALGSTTMELYDKEISSVGEAISPKGQPMPICSRTWNSLNTANVTQPLNVYDLGLLTALSNSYGDNYQKDFENWFSGTSLTRVEPVVMPESSEEAIGEDNKHTIKYIIYRDTSTNRYIITIRSINWAQHLLRNVDYWGESMALQASAILAPQITAWPEQAKIDYVNGLSFLKKAVDGDDEMAELRKKILDLGVPQENIIITGHGFNGGLAKIIARKFENVQAVAFNAPGTAMLKKKFALADAQDRIISIESQRGILSYVDSQADVGSVQSLACDDDSQYVCGSMKDTLDRLSKGCGDARGRSMKDV